MELTKAAIQRPVFVLMGMIAIFLMGFLAYKNMRVELNPDVSFGVATVTTTYPGADPAEVNTLISRKIEDAVSGINNIQEIVATSQEGVSSVVITFEVGTDMNVALDDVRTKVDAAVGSLPKDADKPVVDKNDTSSSPVMTLAMTSDKMSSQALRDLIDQVLADKFARIKGVAQVGVNGGDKREIEVQISKDALVRYGVGIVDIDRAIQGATVNIPSGRVVAGPQEYTVRMLGEYQSVKEIGDTFLSLPGVASGDPVRRIRLGDIATIKDTIQEVRSHSRVNGKPAVVMVLQKTKQGNAVDISHAIVEDHNIPNSGGKAFNLLESIEHDYGVKTIVTNNTATQISESIQDLIFTLFFGIFLVSMVVWLFLHDLRGTLIVAIAIPVCIFATFIAYQAMGFTINNLSMLALSLAVGVLVDDAIVVLENIFRHLQKGEDPRDAALNGRGEIGLAALAITAADVVVFLPIGTMGGIVGQFFRPLGLGYAVCVLFSLIVSFTVTPMLAARWFKAGEDLEHPKTRFSKWFEDRFHAFANRYRNLLRFSLHHRWFMFGGGFAALFGLITFIVGGSIPDFAGAVFNPLAKFFMTAVFVLGFLITVIGSIRTRKFNRASFIGTFAFMAVFPVAALIGFGYHSWKGEAVFKQVFIPASDGGLVSVNIQTPPDSSLAYTEQVVKYVEDKANQNPDTEYVVANVGTQGGGFSTSSQGTQYAQVNVTLRDKVSFEQQLLPFLAKGQKLRYNKDTAVAASLTQAIGHYPGAKITVAAAGGFAFGADIQLSFRSDDSEKLLATAVKVRDALAGGAIKGIITPDISANPGKQELRAIPDRARLADYNISASDVGAAMRLMYEGDDTTKYREKGNEYPLRVMMDRNDRDNAAILDQVPITFNRGNPVFLNEVATIVSARGVDKIDRHDRQETVNVTAYLLPGFAAGTVQAEIDKWLVDNHMVPTGVSYKPLGQADTQNREQGYLMGALGLGLILVYMVLASLFDNILYPLVIQLAQPQAMIGALLALIFTDKTLNIVGMIGIIALVGLVGKNAILLVDYTNTLRARGETREEALIESGGTRIRPIMMTTLALLVGMMPVALALGRGSEFRETIGITIIGGTLLSTVLTLLVIPCSYSIFDDGYAWIVNLFTRKEAKVADTSGDNPSV